MYLHNKMHSALGIITVFDGGVFIDWNRIWQHTADCETYRFLSNLDPALSSKDFKDNLVPNPVSYYRNCCILN